MADIHKGDTGTQLVVAVVDEAGAAVNVSAATAKTIYLQKPSGAVLTRAAVNDTTGADGKIRYDTAAGDLDEAGTWCVQAHVVLSASVSFKTAVGTFAVADNIA